MQPPFCFLYSTEEITFQRSKLNGASGVSTSEVRVSAML